MDDAPPARDPRFAELDTLIARQNSGGEEQKNQTPPLLKASHAPLPQDDTARRARERDARQKRDLELRAIETEARAKRAAAAPHGVDEKDGGERAARLKREAAERALARKMLALSRSRQKNS